MSFHGPKIVSQDRVPGLAGSAAVAHNPKDQEIAALLDDSAREAFDLDRLLAEWARDAVDLASLSSDAADVLGRR